MSDRVLARLARANRTGAFLAVAALVFFGLFLPGVIGGVVLLALAAGLVWLLLRTWPLTAPNMRTVRVLILALLIAVAMFKIVKW
jgi:hypothetical protein